MSPSAFFWLNTLIDLTVGLLALASLLLVVGRGLRQRLNQAFGLFAASAAVVGISSAAANMTFWLNSRAPATSGDSAHPVFWLELTVAGSFFVGPALLAFSMAFADNVSIAECAQDNPPARKRVYKVAVVLGFAASVGLLPILFNGWGITRPHLNHFDVLRWEFTAIGYVAFASSFFLQLLAVNLCWRNRRRLGGLTLVIGATILLIGSTFYCLSDVLLPVENLTLGFGVLIAGYTVANCQLLNPLHSLTDRLEATVNERSRDLQQAKNKLQRLFEQQLRAVQITREITQVTDGSPTLTRLVDLIHNRLGYHHIYLYQPDEANRYLVVKAAAGTTARTVMEAGRRLRMGGRSLAGQAAVERRPRIAEARGDDAIFFGDTALPGARSEMALPLLAGERLVGVLTLQSIHYEAFSDEDLGMMTSLADQVAVALDNARLRQEAETALAEVEDSEHQYVCQAWQETFEGSEIGPAFIYRDGVGVAAANVRATWSTEIAQAVNAGQAVISNGGEHGQARLALPIVVRGQVIGAVQLCHKQDRTWQSDAASAVSEAVERLGLALETARLSREARQRASREQLIGHASARMRESLDVETVLKTAAQELRQAMGLPEVVIRLSDQFLSKGDNGTRDNEGNSLRPGTQEKSL